jgi:hypothetical protein
LIAIVKVGDPLQLSVDLEDGETDLYPQAELLDADEAAISGSPVDLVHTSDGRYVNQSVAMPSTQEVIARYKIYVDAAHTTLSEDYVQRITERFIRNDNSEALEQLISGTLPGQELIGFLEDDGELTGHVFDDGLFLTGEIETNGELLGFIEDEEFLEGFVQGPTTELQGFVQC